MTRWVTTHVAARVLGVTQSTVRRHCVVGRQLYIAVQRTPGGHIRLDLERVKQMRDRWREIFTEDGDGELG